MNIKSEIPYSSVDNTWVYKGKSRNIISLEPNVPRAKIPISLINLIYLFSIALNVTYFSLCVKSKAKNTNFHI